eukprot:scaffold1697_cov120-Cylindrotheca_fusiformis.AAC.25
MMLDTVSLDLFVVREFVRELDRGGEKPNLKFQPWFNTQIYVPRDTTFIVASKVGRAMKPGN